jgi:hypothetical protein
MAGRRINRRVNRAKRRGSRVAEHRLSSRQRSGGNPAYYQARANGVSTADEWFKTDVEKPRTVKVMER